MDWPLPGTVEHSVSCPGGRKTLLGSPLPYQTGTSTGRRNPKMAGPAGPKQTLKTHLLLYLGVWLLYWTSTYGLEYQEWVLIRTTDGTVIATNKSWESLPVKLTTDFSKVFYDKLCYRED